MFTMGAAERLTGLTQRQIRYYEAKGLVRLARSPSGQRLLTARDIRQLRRIRWLLQQGHNVHTMRVILAADGAGLQPQRGARENGGQWVNNKGRSTASPRTVVGR
ncbi:putative transcriptional regulator [Thermaerobacter subterraneus DSM 13965]|uniref:Transcriptional regulator n=2 Tax=Thermaerobacter TaxID=73918 RepID=K6QCF8_9FIRM|nr:putative transcriptional regulator [Thermaerobacter subterraneus DSM 13965]